jgi:hypothetical protein
MTFVAGAEQMMLKLPAPTTAPAIVQPTVVAPAGIPPAAKPPNPNAQMLPQKPASPSLGNGMSFQSPDMACVTNNTPRISNINGMQSGIKFKPGDTLDIVGCGFGKDIGKVVLRDDSVPLIVTDWNNAHIKAHIDPALSRVSDFAGGNLNVLPNGAPTLSSKAVYSFRAAREDVFVAVDAKPHNGAAVVYSNIYGAPTTSITATSTKVSRNLARISGFCPQVTDQASQMSDFFPVGQFNSGFDVTAIYTEETDQTNWETQKEQMILVGNSGSATYIAHKGVRVTFQGHSTYTKKYLLSGGYSACTSSYSISLKLTGPRGVPSMWEFVESKP